jgi:hypothetical protein
LRPVVPQEVLPTATPVPPPAPAPTPIPTIAPTAVPPIPTAVLRPLPAPRFGLHCGGGVVSVCRAAWR